MRLAWRAPCTGQPTGCMRFAQGSPRDACVLRFAFCTGQPTGCMRRFAQAFCTGQPTACMRFVVMQEPNGRTRARHLGCFHTHASVELVHFLRLLPICLPLQCWTWGGQQGGRRRPALRDLGLGGRTKRKRCAVRKTAPNIATQRCATYWGAPMLQRDGVCCLSSSRPWGQWTTKRLKAPAPSRVKKLPSGISMAAPAALPCTQQRSGGARRPGQPPLAAPGSPSSLLQSLQRHRRPVQGIAQAGTTSCFCPSCMVAWPQVPTPYPLPLPAASRPSQ